MGILTNPDRDMVAETFSATVIESFEERLKNEKDYYFHTTALIGLPEGYDLNKLMIPSPKCVIDCRKAAVDSVTKAFNKLKEDTHYIVLDYIYSLSKDDDLRWLLYHCVKESVFRADRLIILVFRYKEEEKGKRWTYDELAEKLCEEFPCIQISEDRKGRKDIFFGNVFEPSIGNGIVSYNRRDVLLEKINKILMKRDRCDKWSLCDLVNLKTTLNDINNVITLEITLHFIDWLEKEKIINKGQADKMRHDVLATKPNTNGFDIQYAGADGDVPILAEVKCCIPVQTDDFGSNQKDSIQRDIDSLRNGKKKAKGAAKTSQGVSTYYRFLVVMDYGSSRNAVEKLISKQSDVEIYSGQNLDSTKIYVVMIS